jgi:predicted MFS family arabinose efflux permease
VPRTSPIRAAILVCALGALSESLFYTALAPLLPGIGRDLDLSHTLAAVLVAGYAIGYVIGALPGYALTSRYAPRTAGALGIALVALGTAGFAAGGDLPVLLGARILVGAGAVVAYTGLLAAAAEIGGLEARGSAIGRVYAGSAAGGALGPLAGAAADAVGRGPVFASLAGLQTIVAVLIARLPATPPIGAMPLRSVLAQVRYRRVRIGLWITAIPGFTLGVLTVSGSYRIAELGGTSLAIAIGFSGIAVINVFLNPRIGNLSDRLGRERPTAIALSGAAIALLAIILAAFEVSTIALIALTGALMMSIGGPGLALIGDEIARRGGDPAQATLLMNLFWGPTAALGAIAAGIFHDAVGAVLAFGMLAAVAAVSAAVVYRESRVPRTASG